MVQNRRAWPRVSINANVTLSSPTVQDLVDGRLHDISLGGLFLKSSKIRPIGTTVSLTVVVLAERLEIHAQGVVVRAVTVEESAATGRPAGMGIMFATIDEASRQSLAQLIEAELGSS